MLARRLGLAVAIVGLWAGAAAAEEDPSRKKSHFTVAFAGGALAPVNDMKDWAATGLDVGARLGWNASSGLGLVANLEYAPLQRDEAQAFTDVQSHLFVATAAPRFTLGHRTFRMWFAFGGGMVIERVRTEVTMPTGIISSTEVDKEWAVNGSAGIDLHVFTNGGLTLAGAYTRSFNDEPYDYFAATAGLVFTL